MNWLTVFWHLGLCSAVLGRLRVCVRAVVSRGRCLGPTRHEIMLRKSLVLSRPKAEVSVGVIPTRTDSNLCVRANDLAGACRN